MSNSNTIDLVEIEERIEKRWLEEFEKYKKEQDARVERYSYMKRICERALINANIVFEDNGQLTDAMVDRMCQLIGMGNDFERILAAIKAEPTVNEAWDNLLMVMRLCGLDENQT